MLEEYERRQSQIGIIWLLHDNMRATVTSNETATESFDIRTGVIQASVLCPTLLPVFLSAALSIPVRTLSDSVRLLYRGNGSLFNLGRLQPKTKVTPTSMIQLQCADNAVVCVCALGKKTTDSDQ